MAGRGITGLLFWWRRGKRRTAELVVEALNARHYDKLEALLVEDLLYLDTMSNAIEGRSEFIAANLRLHRDAPDLTIVLDDFSETGGALLIKGRTLSSVPAFCSESLWRVEFAGDRVRELQAFRDHNAVSLPLLAWRDDGD